MIELVLLKPFELWLKNLKDRKAQGAIGVRLKRLRKGLDGDVKPVGNGFSEIRIDTGKGYRVYFKRHGNQLIIVLCGSQKKDQQKQIQNAKQLFSEWEKQNE